MPASPAAVRAGAILAESGDGATVRYSSSITIEELTGTGENQPRRVVLRGPSMPFMGAEWGGCGNVVTTFYTGNPRGSQQVLGPKELPSAWEGEWNRTLLGKTPVLYTDETGVIFNITRPDLVWDVLEDIFRKQALLRVTWSTHGAEMIGDFTRTYRVINSDRVRDGRATEWKFKPDRHTDIKWSISFAWLGRGDEQLRAADVRSDSDLAASANGLANEIITASFLAENKAKSLLSDVRRSASNITLGQLEAFAQLPNDLVTATARQFQAAINDVKRVVNLGQTIGSVPDQIQHTFADFAKNTQAIARQFDDQNGRIPCEKTSTIPKVSSVLRSWMYGSRMQDQARVIARVAQQLIDKNREFKVDAPQQGRQVVSDTNTTRAGEIMATYVTKDGDTPQLVSMRFYNTPDRAVDILRMNRLPWYTPTFDRGKILVIPRLPTSTRT